MLPKYPKQQHFKAGEGCFNDSGSKRAGADCSKAPVVGTGGGRDGNTIHLEEEYWYISGLYFHTTPTTSYHMFNTKESRKIFDFYRSFILKVDLMIEIFNSILINWSGQKIDGIE